MVASTGDFGVKSSSIITNDFFVFTLINNYTLHSRTIEQKEGKIACLHA